MERSCRAMVVPYATGPAYSKLLGHSGSQQAHGRRAFMMMRCTHNSDAVPCNINIMPHPHSCIGHKGSSCRCHDTKPEPHVRNSIHACLVHSGCCCAIF